METFLKKYEPKVLDEININESVKHLLELLIDLNEVNLLIHGDTGTGKSVLIKLLIYKYFEGLKYKDFKENVLFINLLKEQGIQYYRNDVQIFCQTASSIANKKKLIIIDDIDMISEAGQQVFRNLIDKYNSKICVIIGCSNLIKVLNNLQSRLSIIQLLNFNNESLKPICDKIMLQEKLKITQFAKNIILSHCNNSVRLLVNYLEKCSLINDEINASNVYEICNNISDNTFKEYINLCKSKQIYDGYDILLNLYNQGYSVMDIYDNLFSFIKICSLYTEKEKYGIIKIICKYINIFNNYHEDEIELLYLTYYITNI
jgi:DNA polymerase III delta prime subunit